MALLTCSFCNHANPDGSKFCNECGSGFGLRPCLRCEAINDAGATYCHNCGTLLDAAPAALPDTAVAPQAGDAPPESSVIRAVAEASPDLLPGRTAAAVSVKELASAAERLEAFWRDSMQAVEVARGMQVPAPADTAPHPVAILPLRVDGESSVIDVQPGGVHRPSASLAIGTFGVLLFAAGIAYYGYERSTLRHPVAAADAPREASAPSAAASNAAAVKAPEPSQPPSAGSVSASAASSSEVAIAAPASRATAGAQPDAAAAVDAAPAEEPAPRAESPSLTPQPAPTAATADAPPAEAATPPTAATAAPEPAPTLPSSARSTDAVKASGRPSSRRAPAQSRMASAPRLPPRRFPPPPAADAYSPPPLPAVPVPASPPPAAVANCTDSVAALGLCTRR